MIFACAHNLPSKTRLLYNNFGFLWVDWEYFWPYFKELLCGRRHFAPKQWNRNPNCEIISGAKQVIVGNSVGVSWIALTQFQGHQLESYRRPWPCDRRLFTNKYLSRKEENFQTNTNQESQSSTVFLNNVLKPTYDQDKQRMFLNGKGIYIVVEERY